MTQTGQSGAKSQIRKRIRQLLRNLSSSEIAQSSSTVSQHLIQCASSKRAQVIAVYAAIGSEINLEDFANWAQSEGKVVAFPVLEPVGSSGLEPMGSDVLEPANVDKQACEIHSAAEKSDAGYNMSLRTWEVGAAFQQGPFRIPEPVGGTRLDFEECNLVMTPGLAFGREGERLGKGKGYYDRALAFLSDAERPAKTLAIGICHDFQIIDRVPVLPTDILMDALAAPSGLVRC